MTEYQEPYFIGEIGCNHNGNFSHAKELIKELSIIGIPCVKFQKRCPKECLTLEQYNSPHPNPSVSFGETYGTHREFLEFSWEQHQDLKEYCNELGIEYSTSVWDLTSAKEIVEKVKPRLIKIPSACNEHKELLTYICENFEGEIHISTGMSSNSHILKIIAFFSEMSRKKDLILYHCISGYPVNMEDVCLLEIKRLYDLCCPEILGIGFSGHHRGIAVDCGAYLLGASRIERHVTKDRCQKGNDHSSSLEMQGVFKLWRDLQAIYAATKYKEKDFLDCEIDNMKKLKTTRTL